MKARALMTGIAMLLATGAAHADPKGIPARVYALHTG